MRREVVLTPMDVALLDHLARDPSLSNACRSLDLSPDRGRYRLQRLNRALGSAVTDSTRGGAGGGQSALTAAGRALLDAGAGAVVGPSRISRHQVGVEGSGTWSPGPVPSVRLDAGPTLAVVFRAVPGERVRVGVDPASIVVATRRFATSARNVLKGTVRSIRSVGPGTGGAQRALEVDVDGWRFSVPVTPEAIRALRLARGTRVYLYLKATAVRRLSRPATRGSPRS